MAARPSVVDRLVQPVGHPEKAILVGAGGLVLPAVIAHAFIDGREVLGMVPGGDPLCDTGVRVVGLFLDQGPERRDNGAQPLNGSSQLGVVHVDGAFGIIHSKFSVAVLNNPTVKRPVAAHKRVGGATSASSTKSRGLAAYPAREGMSHRELALSRRAGRAVFSRRVLEISFHRLPLQGVANMRAAGAVVTRTTERNIRRPNP